MKKIYNTGNLYWFANYVNKGGDCANADAVLVNNIEDNSNVINEKGELNSENRSSFKTWAVIGNRNSMGQTVYYKGTFDGQGHTISGLYINSGNYCGLFGNNQGTIQNVGVINSYFYITYSSGGICTNNNGTIQNCFNTSTVKAENEAGGICYNNTSDGKIINCYNSGLVKLSSESNKEFDGICVSNEGAITNCYNNSDFTKSTCEGVTNYITPDICNGKLFEGFDEDIWVAGTSNKPFQGKFSFKMPNLKNGQNINIKGILTINFNKSDSYYFDTYTIDNFNSIELKYLDVTKNDKEHLIINCITDNNNIECEYYGIPFTLGGINIKDYVKTEFVWNTTSTPVTAQIKLFTDEENFVTKDCDVTEIEKTEPTCTTNGSVKYIAKYGKYSTDNYKYTEDKTIPLPALGHKYKAPTFTWTNYTKSVATFVCEKDDDSQTIDGVITSKIEKEPTTEAEGLKVYTATFNFNGDTYTDTKKETLAKLGTTPTFTWNYDSNPPTATFTLLCDENNMYNVGPEKCKISEDSKIEPSCTKTGSIVYKATYNTYTDNSKSIELPVLGHKYKAPTFTWTNYTKSVATFVCEKDDDSQTIDGVITSKIEKEPTTEAEGLKVYTATFNFNGDTYTDTKKETLAKLDPTPTNEISQNSQYKVWGYNNNIYIETENIDSQIQIFDINGRLIKSLKSTNTHTEININKGGIFVVVINNNIFKVAM
ncbi:MAG: T9SS type A sorting domain-containing protein [Bacteroidales bacterium]|nr:T9SS type A sorting domain-containing protein [Bacteroidales bacterium]